MEEEEGGGSAAARSTSMCASSPGRDVIDKAIDNRRRVDSISEN